MQIITGIENIDTKELENSTTYEDGYKSNSVVVRFNFILILDGFGKFYMNLIRSRRRNFYSSVLDLIVFQSMAYLA